MCVETHEVIYRVSCKKKKGKKKRESEKGKSNMFSCPFILFQDVFSSSGQPKNKSSYDTIIILRAFSLRVCKVNLYPLLISWKNGILVPEEQ